jgi:crotonobetainyl-CoA:carnitine CoA-transferase CaiB-like acyl-CoA transferase
MEISAMNLPLTGIRVLDLSRIFAGPYAAQCLADMGAEVVKVERPLSGDDMRLYGPPFLRDKDGKPTRESSYYLGANRNKKGVTIDLAKEAGQKLVRELAKQSDILVENYKVGDLCRYGLDYESVMVINPAIIYCSITGFGQSGPYASRPGLDALFQAMSGLQSLSGEPEGLPMRAGVIAGDLFAGMYASYAILGALYYRDRNNGAGQYIDLSILDTTIALTSHRAIEYFITGELPPRLGNGTKGSVPSNLFRAADGYLMLTASRDDDFRRFADAIERPDLKDDPRYSTRAARASNGPELMDILAKLFIAQPLAHWMNRLEAARIVFAPVLNFQQVFDDPQVRHRGMSVEVDHPLSGPTRLLRNPVRMSETPLEKYEPPPILGQHTNEVLTNRLGLSEQEIEELRRNSVI